MNKKLLCGMLAALLLLGAVSCTGGETTDGPPTTTAPVTDTQTSDTEAPTGQEPEQETEADTEAETDFVLPEIQAPAYEDVDLVSLFSGLDQRTELHYDFAKYSYSKLRADNALVFTSNKDYKVDANGLTLDPEGWNSVGFSHTLTEAYTAKASIINRGAVNNVRSIMMGCRVTRSDHLYIDSGLWFTFSGSSVFVHVKGSFVKLIRGDFAFDAKEGLNVTLEDDGTTICCFVNDILVAKAVIEDTVLAVYDAQGVEIGRTADLARIAHGDTLGYVRTMSHFADSSTRSMSLSTGEIIPYSPADRVTEIREGYSYLLSEKTQHKCSAPIYFAQGTVLMDAKAVAAMFDYAYSADATTATLTTEKVVLQFTRGESAAKVNGKAVAFPTVVKQGDTFLIAADYVARWMGYTVKIEDRVAYFALDESKLTKEKVQEMSDRYQLYQDVIYNYDDVEIEQIGVGAYEATPYEDRLVGIAYSTWLCPKIITWGKNTWDTPLYGNYFSDDREMIAKHAELLRDAGVDFVFVDWTNNTTYDPATMREQLSDFRMIEEATDLLFEIWSTIEGAPKICIFAGPGHSGIENVKNGKHQKKVDQIYTSYVEKYPDLYFQYEGKPLLMCYGATPNQYGTRPSWKDSRFTIRWVTGYVSQQSDLHNTRNLSTRNNWWSWEERGLQSYSVLDGRVECVTCTAASRSQGSEGSKDYIPAYGRDNGMTLKKQFQRANDLGAGMVILVSWNEWTKGEQPSPEISKDLEPSVIHGTFYYDLLCEQIKKFKGKLVE